MYSESKPGRVYSQQDALDLSSQIYQLSHHVTQLLAKNPELTHDAKKVLLQVDNTVREPTYSNYYKLAYITDTVNGQRNKWAQIGMVLVAILGLLCAIIPGVLYINTITQKNGLWDQNKRQGLSLESMKMKECIRETNAASRVSRGTFFQDEAQIPEEAADDAVNHSKAPLTNK